SRARHRFQSSPAPKGGSHGGRLCDLQQRRGVSILSRPEGREPHTPPHSSSAWRGCFNPLPPRRAGATPGTTGKKGSDYEFQSSPAPKGGSHPTDRTVKT